MKDEIRKGRKNKNRSVSSNEILHIYIYIEGTDTCAK